MIDIALATSKLGASPAISVQIWTAREVDVPVGDTWSEIITPTEYIKAADSPIILPILSSVPDRIPGNADLIITLKVVW